MGKAHTCVLMKNGEVWTFGVNNKGQCGRDTGAMNQGGKGRCYCINIKLCVAFSLAFQNNMVKNLTIFKTNDSLISHSQIRKTTEFLVYLTVYHWNNQIHFAPLISEQMFFTCMFS